MDTDRLRQLLLMLSSDQSGEVVNAARAVTRLLRADGYDWHWLASQLGSAQPISAADLKLALHRIKELEAELANLRADQESGDSWIKAADEIWKSSTLTTVERNFIEDMRARFLLNPSYKPSDKQINWFLRIYRTHVKRAAA